MKKETNLEHYKEDLKHIINCYRGYSAAINDMIRKKLDKNFNYTGVTYNGYFTDYILDWMAQPYEAPILDSVEKRYLKSVIKPFKDKITFICKCELKANRYYIRIVVNSAVLPSGLDSIYFPIFIGDTMYKGMEPNKTYTLKELGL